MAASESFCLCRLQEDDVEREDLESDADEGQRVFGAIAKSSGDVHLFDVETTGALPVLFAAVPCAAGKKTPFCSERMSNEMFTC